MELEDKIQTAYFVAKGKVAIEAIVGLKTICGIASL